MRTALFGIVIITVLLACHSRHRFDHRYFHIGTVKGKLKNNDIDEASGLAASVVNPGRYWVHNDSGDKPRIFLIGDEGEMIGEVNLPTLKNRDWEDIAVGPGPDPAASYVFVGDIGDNNGKHEVKYIHRLREPRFDASDEDQKMTLTDTETISFTLPNGPRDAEALMVDPWTKDLFVISKREPGSVFVYTLPFPQPTDRTVEATLVCEIPFQQIVAGDISADGRELLIKNYGEVMYWQRQEGEAIGAVLKRAPAFLPYATEPQGEAIAFDREGLGYYTVSERAKNKPPRMIFYKRKQQP